MSYSPTNWQNGDIITAEKLNKLENGVAESSGSSSDSNIEIIDIDVAYPSMVATSSHTFAQILSAYQSGKLIIARLYSPILGNVEITYHIELTTNEDIFSFFFQNFSPTLNDISGTYTTVYGGHSFIIEISADGASVYDVSTVQIEAQATVLYHRDME